MKAKTVLVAISLCCIGYSIQAQIDFPKDTIYLKFDKNVDCKKYDDLPSKRKAKDGIHFNLCSEGLFAEKSIKPDTLCNKHLSEYKITKPQEIDELKKRWYKMAIPLLREYYGSQYPNTRDKNDMFVTYIIEPHKDYFVIYNVYWKYQHIIPESPPLYKRKKKLYNWKYQHIIPESPIEQSVEGFFGLKF